MEVNFGTDVASARPHFGAPGIRHFRMVRGGCSTGLRYAFSGARNAWSDTMTEMLDGGKGSVVASVGFARAPFAAALSTLLDWRRNLGASPRVTEVDGERSVVASLSPERHPWSTEAMLRCDGDDWTAYVNEGADPWPATSFVARRLSTDAVVAVHSVNPPHASTQFQLIGPTGEPPRLYVRTLAAHCEDGRWKWYANGRQQPFEDPHRYSARRIKDRLNRPLLMQYLSALGIETDRSNFVGGGVIITK